MLHKDGKSCSCWIKVSGTKQTWRHVRTWLASSRVFLVTSGLILEHVASANNMRDFKKLFRAAGLGDCSSHSIRRSPSHWGRRCGADTVVIRNIGRWVACANLLIYIAAAEKVSRDKRRRNYDRDPVWDFWMFDTDSQSDAMNKVAS
jgi:hypothetical protein